MPYLALDDQFPSNSKVVGLSDRAFRLHVIALCHCSAQLTDGLVVDNPKVWANMGGLRANIRSFTRITEELCSAGLWEKVNDGFLIHDYLDWNASAAQIKEKRRRDRARKRGKALNDSERNPSGNDKAFRADSAGSASREVLRTSLTAPASKEAAGAGSQHQQLLAAVRRFVHGWKGGGSDVFDEALDELEHLYGARLEAGERYAFWDQGLAQEKRQHADQQAHR